MKLNAKLSPDRVYRYRLSRIWNDNVPPLMWLMLNPSTADESRDDPTIRRCIGYSINFGFGGIVIHNLFAYRSTDWEKLKYINDPVGPDNDDGIIDDAVKLKVVCGWGNHALDPKLIWRLDAVFAFLFGLDLNYLKLTSRKTPNHPLYLKSTLTLQKLPSQLGR
jgi:hypothetical protein